MQVATRRGLATAICVLFAVLVPTASARQQQWIPVPALNWQACGEAPNVSCTTARVPLDYDRPRGQSIELFRWQDLDGGMAQHNWIEPPR